MSHWTGKLHFLLHWTLLQKTMFLLVMYHIEVDPQLFPKSMKRASVKAIIIGGFDNTIFIARLIEEQFACQISVQII